ncbi:hypothetical protein Bbelb_098690 [Branchiostoma belcheri]|nr:hypothetical protein Bbelb_098690 [Branchiostoma belcheri]
MHGRFSACRVAERQPVVRAERTALLPDGYTSPEQTKFPSSQPRLNLLLPKLGGFLGNSALKNARNFLFHSETLSHFTCLSSLQLEFELIANLLPGNPEGERSDPKLVVKINVVCVQVRCRLVNRVVLGRDIWHSAINQQSRAARNSQSNQELTKQPGTHKTTRNSQNNQELTKQPGTHKTTRNSQNNQELTKQPGTHKTTRNSQNNQELTKQPGTHKTTRNSQNKLQSEPFDKREKLSAERATKWRLIRGQPAERSPVPRSQPSADKLCRRRSLDVHKEVNFPKVNPGTSRSDPAPRVCDAGQVDRCVLSVGHLQPVTQSDSLWSVPSVQKEQEPEEGVSHFLWPLL